MRTWYITIGKYFWNLWPWPRLKTWTSRCWTSGGNLRGLTFAEFVYLLTPSSARCWAPSTKSPWIFEPTWNPWRKRTLRRCVEKKRNQLQYFSGGEGVIWVLWSFWKTWREQFTCHRTPENCVYLWVKGVFAILSSRRGRQPCVCGRRYNAKDNESVVDFYSFCGCSCTLVIKCVHACADSPVLVCIRCCKPVILVWSCSHVIPRWQYGSQRIRHNNNVNNNVSTCSTSLPLYRNHLINLLYLVPHHLTAESIYRRDP